MPTESVASRLRDLAARFPAPLVEAQLQDVARVAFQIGLVEARAGRGVRLCDIGSGVGLFAPGCALLGMRVTIVDDLRHPFAEGSDPEAFPDAPDSVNYAMAEKALDVHRSLGVEIQRRDAVAEKFDFPPESLDVVTCFDSMEHWHHSPKRLFAGVREALVPGGLFILSTPNAANLRKRITGLLGRAKWSEMAHWYETERFRGHVREPDVDDLRYVARDMALADVEIFGRNWVGHLSRRRWVRWSTRLADHALRLRPTLCSDIYLVGRKPRDAGSTALTPSRTP